MSRTGRRPKSDRRRAGPSPKTQAQKRKERWKRWVKDTAGAQLPPCARKLASSLKDLAEKRLDCEGVIKGYGGAKDATHRAYLEDRDARGLPIPEGLAEVTGMCRSSMIRGIRQLVAAGLLMVIFGGGSRPDGTGIGGRGLANEYRLPTPLAEDDPPPPPAPRQMPEDRAHGRELLRLAVDQLGQRKAATWSPASTRSARGP